MKIEKKLWITLFVFGLFAIGFSGWIFSQSTAREKLLWDNTIRFETKKLTDKPFGVNIMLMNPESEKVAKVIVEEGVKVVTTGAGSPEKYMEAWKAAGVKVIPVVASVALARRMERCGADAVVAEGTESG